MMPADPIKGVAFTPPPPHLLQDALRIVNDGVAQLPPETRVGLIFVGSKDPGQPFALNAALVVKTGPHVAVTTWIGKKWGEELSGGFGGRVLW